MKRISTYLTHALSILCVLLCLASCSSSRRAVDTGTYLSSKVKLTVPYQGNLMTVNGTMKMISGERLQLSLLMPVIRSEMVRIELTPDTLLLVERMDKHYLQASRAELKPYLPRKADFAHLEKLLFRAARNDKEVTLNVSDLGLPKLEGCRLVLSNFSYKPLELNPTRLSSKYRRVEPAELVNLLGKLLN